MLIPGPCIVPSCMLALGVFESVALTHGTVRCTPLQPRELLGARHDDTIIVVSRAHTAQMLAHAVDAKVGSDEKLVACQRKNGHRWIACPRRESQ
jgi:hypothetical protein